MPNYLKSSGLDFVKAYKMIQVTTESLKNISRDFNATIVSEANTFVARVNSRGGLAHRDTGKFPGAPVEKSKFNW